MTKHYLVAILIGLHKSPTRTQVETWRRMTRADLLRAIERFPKG